MRGFYDAVDGYRLYPSLKGNPQILTPFLLASFIPLVIIAFQEALITLSQGYVKEWTGYFWMGESIVESFYTFLSLAIFFLFYTFNPWYQQIILAIKSRVASKNHEDVWEFRISYLILLICFAFTSFALTVVPYLGTWMAFIHFSWYFSLMFVTFCWKFEEERPKIRFIVYYFQLNWSYFLGFGAPLASLIFFLPLKYMIFGYICLYPYYILLASRKQFKKHVHRKSATIVDMFQFPQTLQMLLLKFIIRYLNIQL